MAAAVSRSTPILDTAGMEIRPGDRVCRLVAAGGAFTVLGRGKVTRFEGRRVRWLDDQGNWHVSIGTALKITGRAKEPGR